MKRFIPLCILAVIIFAVDSPAAQLDTKVDPSVMNLISRGENRPLEAAGLAMRLRIDKLPLLTPLPGEVFLDGQLRWHNPQRRRPPSLRPGFGNISIPGCRSLELAQQEATWVANQMTFAGQGENAGKTLDLWLSRLTPAVVAGTNTGSVQLLTGMGKSDVPGFCAFGTTEGVKKTTLGNQVNAPDGVEWVLLWYGRNMPGRAQRDVPLLIIPHNKLRSLQIAESGGVQLDFAQKQSRVSLILANGISPPGANETKTWLDRQLPKSVTDYCNWWGEYAGQFPVNVTESCSYNSAIDRVNVRYKFEFEKLDDHYRFAAPVPPMLALAYEQGLQDAGSPVTISFSLAPSDTSTPTIFGPYCVLQGAKQYDWTMTGLGKYSLQVRRAGNSVAASKPFEKKLSAEIRKITERDFLRPWIIQDECFGGVSGRERLYWANPGKNLYFLMQTRDLLGEQLQGELDEYLHRYVKEYPPAEQGFMSPEKGQPREFSYARPDKLRLIDVDKSPDIYNLYALSEYYSQTDAELTEKTWKDCVELFSNYLRGRDWPTLFWFGGRGENEPGVVQCNRKFAGLIGLVRLSRKISDQQTRDLAYGHLARTAALRYAMGKYRRFLYQSGAIEMPPAPDWQVQTHIGDWQGHLVSYDCTRPADDVEQIYSLNQFEVRTGTYDPRGWEAVTRPYQFPFRDMVPEMGRFLADLLKPEAKRYEQVVAEYQPDWYISWAEATLGTEHNLTTAGDPYQNFLARAWVTGEPPEKLRKYIDVPHVKIGDYFYIHKLAETARAYRGIEWKEVD